MLGEVWLVKGGIERRLEHTEEALECFDRATRLSPRDARGWMERAQCLVLLRREPERVLEYCHKAAELGGVDLPLFGLTQGRALYELEQYDEAIEAFERAIASISAEDKQIRHALWVQKATCYAQIDREREAADCYVEALRLDPEQDSLAEFASTCFQIGYPEALEDLEEGGSLLQNGAPAGALTCYTRARRACPNWWEIWEKEGAALLMLRRFEEAAERLSEVLLVYANTPNTWLALAICEFNLRRPDRGLQALDQVLRRDETMADAWFLKAQILLDRGDRAGARRCFERASALDPKHPNLLQER